MINQILIDVDHIRSHSCETTRGDRRTTTIEVEDQVACLVLAAVQITVIETIATATMLISTANLLYGTVRISLAIGAQERILTRTDVCQTTIVQLDIVVSANKHTTTVAFSLVFEVLQINVVTLFVATADTDL